MRMCVKKILFYLFFQCDEISTDLYWAVKRKWLKFDKFEWDKKLLENKNYLIR